MTPLELSRGQVNIFPGNIDSGQPGEKFIFQQLLPLEVKEREERLHREILTWATKRKFLLHREIKPSDKWWVTEMDSLIKPTCLKISRSRRETQKWPGISRAFPALSTP